MTAGRAPRAIFLFCLALLPWVALQFSLPVNFDIFWLTEGFERLLRGMTMQDGIYETNPPLALFVYALPCGLARTTGLELAHCVTLYVLSLVALSTGAVYALMKRWPFMTGNRLAAVVFAYLSLNTILTTASFGERDQIVGLALVPFVLAQAALAFGWPLPHRLAKVVFIVSPAFILLKPHHGLLPSIMLLYRAARGRGLSVAKDLDFIALAATTSLYIAGTFLFFPDFVRLILPEVARFYLPFNSFRFALHAALAAACGYAAFAAACFMLLDKGSERKAILFLAFAAGISLIPYVVQGFGFFYHILPSLSFFACAAALAVTRAAERFFRSGATAVMAFICFFTAYYTALPQWSMPRAADYASFPLTRLVKDYGERTPCPFFLFTDDMSMIHLTAYYAGEHHASRFPTYWFLPSLVAAETGNPGDNLSGLSQEDLERYKARYAAMAAADLDLWKPRLVLIDHFAVKAGVPFDYPAYFGRYPAFRAAWSAYDKNGYIDINTRDYYPFAHSDRPVRRFDIYFRRHSDR